MHEEDYNKPRNKELSKNIGILAKWGRSQRHRFTQKDEDDMNRLRECPYDMRVSDLPLPYQEMYLTRWQKKFGPQVTPAKLLSIFEDPRTGLTKALVHPCCHRTVENYFHSSVFVDKYTLQYKYCPADDSVQNPLEDCMEPATFVVDVENDVIDRVFVLEEFPSTGSVMNPSHWPDLPQKYGLEPGKYKQKISVETEENRAFRRRASDVRRSVMAVLPQEQWAQEFTLQFPK